MVDAEAATAAAQALADQFAAGEQAVKPEAEEAVPAENGESNQNKRKFDGEDDEVDASMRKRASFTDPTAGDEGAGEEDVKPEVPEVKEDRQTGFSDAPPAGLPEAPPRESGFSDAPADAPATGFSNIPPANYSAAAQAAEYGGNPGGIGPQPGIAGQFTDVVEIPAGMVGKLIGKAGETIKNLQHSTGTKVQIDHQAPGDKKPVTVTGTSAESVTEARRQVESIVSDEPHGGEASRSIDCPQGIVGRIIGRGGETIRALQQASQAHIVVDQNFPEGEPRKINIAGKPDSVERATKMVNELIQGEPGSAQAIIQKYGAGVSKSLDCPKSIVGRVIGKGGETIKTLQKTFGANIQIDQSTDPMKITVAGQPPAVEACAAAVVEIINGGNPFPMGGGGYGDAGYGGYGAGYGAAAGGGFGGYGGYPQQAYGGYGGFPAAAAYPQAYAQPGYGAYGGYGQDPYAAAAGGGYGAGGYGASGAGAGGASSQAAAGGGGVWQELQDGEGRPYYYNTQTGVSQWEKPESMHSASRPNRNALHPFG